MAKQNAQDVRTKLMQAPKGVTAATVERKEIKLDKEGRAEVDYPTAAILESHGFVEVEVKR